MEASCARLTHLTVNEPWAHPAVMEVLLTSPRALVSVTLNLVCYSNFKYPLLELQRILNLHKGTLQELRMQMFPTNIPRIPDLSQFARLRHLSISMYNLMTEEAIIAASKLTAPNLTHIFGRLMTDFVGADPRYTEEESQYRWMTNFSSYKSPRTSPMPLAAAPADEEEANTKRESSNSSHVRRISSSAPPPPAAPAAALLLQNLKSMETEFFCEPPHTINKRRKLLAEHDIELRYHVWVDSDDELPG